MRMNPEATFGTCRFHQAIPDAAVITNVAVKSFHLQVNMMVELLVVMVIKSRKLRGTKSTKHKNTRK